MEREFVQQMVVRLSLDASELERDLDKLETGELKMPTVSGVRVFCDDVLIGDILICLP